MMESLKLENGFFYHIYNRGNNSEIIFKERENYLYFLKLMRMYVTPVADIYSYCLLNNHFHFLLRIKENQDSLNQKNPIQMFSNLFNAYTKAFNKKYNRTGKLFEERFKRKKIEDDFYLTELIFYIHANPQKHKICDDFRNYPYSSFTSLISEKQTDLKRTEVLDWFGGKEQFNIYHEDKYNQLNSNDKSVMFDI